MRNGVIRNTLCQKDKAPFSNLAFKIGPKSVTKKVKELAIFVLLIIYTTRADDDADDDDVKLPNIDEDVSDKPKAQHPMILWRPERLRRQELHHNSNGDNNNKTLALIFIFRYHIETTTTLSQSRIRIIRPTTYYFYYFCYLSLIHI